MARRKSISKKIRFEVFKRDSFKCQYCGKSAPDVVLQIDHIEPVSKGGDNDILNLITACVDCNAGKRDNELDDDIVIRKRKAQLDELQEKREQLEMLLQWHKELISIDEDQIDAVNQLFIELVPGYSLNENGRLLTKKLIRKYGLDEILTCLRLSVEQYLVFRDGKVDEVSVPKTYEYIERIAKHRIRIKDKPYLKDLFYIRGILRNRLNYCNQWRAIELLEEAYKTGIEIDELKELSLEVKNWTEWRNTMEYWIDYSYKHKDKNNG